MAVRLVVALVLLVLVAEAWILSRVTRRDTTAPRFVTLLPNLAAGAFLVLALGSATLPEPLAPVGLFVALGGIAHAYDLRGRLRRPADRDGIPAEP